MSYRISYGPQKVSENNGTKKTGIYMIGTVLLLAALGVGLLWPDGIEMIRLLLFPWLDDQTVSAFQNMIEQIRAGTAVGDALLVFCREVISNAGILV